MDRATSLDRDAVLRGRIRSFRPLPHEVIAIAAILAGIAVLESLPVTYPRSALVLAYLSFALPITGLAFVIAFVANRRRSEWNASDEAIALCRVGAVLALLLPVHFLLKSFLHLVNPRTWDAQLYAWDQRIFFGISPGRFFGALLPTPPLLRAIDTIYSGFYFVLVIGYTAIAFGLLPVTRKFAFAAAFVFLWVGGTVLYIAVPSWGPVFVFSEDFRPALAHMPITVYVQKILFGEISSLVSNPLGRRRIELGSVAAFPSMHLAEMTLLALASRPISHVWFRWNLALVAVMLFGSVVTGFHYLLDGYAGIALALLSWWAGNRMYPGEPVRILAAASS